MPQQAPVALWDTVPICCLIRPVKDMHILFPSVMPNLEGFSIGAEKAMIKYHWKSWAII